MCTELIYEKRENMYEYLPREPNMDDIISEIFSIINKKPVEHSISEERIFIKFRTTLDGDDIGLINEILDTYNYELV